MTDYTELIRSLRNCSNNRCTPCDCGWFNKYQVDESCKEIIMWKAAAAIEELEARLGEAENSVERWKDMYLTKHEPKRGGWERELDVHDEPFYQCSVCGECFDSNRDSTHEVFKYCPDCGAKMEVQE